LAQFTFKPNDYDHLRVAVVGAAQSALDFLQKTDALFRGNAANVSETQSFAHGGAARRRKTS
jgi:hypothetical protein